jgi:hypothetical protein
LNRAPVSFAAAAAEWAPDEPGGTGKILVKPRHAIRRTFIDRP